MRIQTLPLSTYIDAIKECHTFSFARYGDGEWSSIFNKGRQNCDGNRYTPQLKDMLVNSLITAPNGKFQTGMQKMALRMWGQKIYRWLKNHKINRPWHNADVFHTANLKGKLYPFIELLNDRPSVLIAPAYMAKIDINFNDYIITPRKNCESDSKRIVAEMIQLCPGTITCCCLGPSAAGIIRQVYDVIGRDCWLLDIGSIFDPYVNGGRTRRYFKKLDKTIRARNFGKVI